MSAVARPLRCLFLACLIAPPPHLSSRHQYYEEISNCSEIVRAVIAEAKRGNGRMGWGNETREAATSLQRQDTHVTSRALAAAALMPSNNFSITPLLRTVY